MTAELVAGPAPPRLRDSDPDLHSHHSFKLPVNNNPNNVNRVEAGDGDASQRSHSNTAASVHFEWDELVEKPGRIGFVRATYNARVSYTSQSGFLSRMSLAVRRSLRLGPKQRSTAAPTTPHAEAGRRPLRHDEKTFTSYTDLRIRPCDQAFGNMAELRYMIQMNKRTQVKKFIRHNDWPVTHEIRADLWRVLCDYQDFESIKATYSSELDRAMQSGVKASQAVFLEPEGIVVEDHSLKQQGSVALQKILIVIGLSHPAIQFVPILYPLCAVLLHYMQPDETFAAIDHFLKAGSKYLIQSEVENYASQHSLLTLLKKHRKSAYNFLKRRVGTDDNVILAEVFRPWCSWIFKHLPFEYVVRVVDCFLVEGHKMLMRVALSLVYLWYKQRVRSAASATGGQTPEARVAEIAEQICVLAQNCPVSIQTLLDMGFAIRNFKHSTVDHLRTHYENKYRDEVKRRRADKPSPFILPPAAIPFKSSIVDAESAQALIGALPSRYQLETPVLLFRLSEHGASFTQLWSQIDSADQSLLVIRAVSGEIFGAYCSACWAERRDVSERSRARYFGTGESYVFKQPKDQPYPQIYQWAGRNEPDPKKTCQMFMTAGDRFLIIGSGGGDAICIRDELTHGLSYPSETFGNTALVADNAFDIDELEVFNILSSGA